MACTVLCFFSEVHRKRRYSLSNIQETSAEKISGRGKHTQLEPIWVQTEPVVREISGHLLREKETPVQNTRLEPIYVQNG